MNDDLPVSAVPESNRLHQLRNRMTVVKGVAQLLERQVHREDWQREKIIARVDRLQDEIAQLEELIERYESPSGDSPADDRPNHLIH